MSEPSLPAANLWPGNPAEMTFNDPPTFLQMALYNYDVIGPLQLCNSLPSALSICCLLRARRKLGLTDPHRAAVIMSATHVRGPNQIVVSRFDVKCPN